MRISDWSSDVCSSDLLACLAALLLAQPAHADRIKDLGTFQGIRTNQLTGYGIVVGLPGTGDDNLEYTIQSMKSVASRFGLQLPPAVNPALKNSAVVMESGRASCRERVCQYV